MAVVFIGSVLTRFRFFQQQFLNYSINKNLETALPRGPGVGRGLGGMVGVGTARENHRFQRYITIFIRA